MPDTDFKKVFRKISRITEKEKQKFIDKQKQHLITDEQKYDDVIRQHLIKTN